MPKFTDYEKLLWKLAHKHAAKTGREVEELFAEACLAFTLSLRGWEKKRRNTVKFSTYLTHMVFGRFANEGTVHHRRVRVAREQGEEFKIFTNSQNPAGEVSPEDTTIFRSGIDNLSADAKEVVKIVFDCPEELARLTQASIRRFFQTQGWEPKRAEVAFNEISGMLA